MKIIDDFLPQPLLDRIDDTIRTRIETNNQGALPSWTNITWEPYLSEHSALILISPFAEIDSEISDVFDQHRICLGRRPLTSQICTWHRGSMLPWHSDLHASFSATVYLRDWETVHGGLLLWRDSYDNLQVVEPRRNRCVVVDDGQKHMVSQISFAAPRPRFTLQIWGCDPSDVDPNHGRQYLGYD